MYQPTAAVRRDVAIWYAGGMTIEQIAMALDKDADTVRKHFKVELETGWSKIVAQVVKARFDAATKGKNVTAQTKFLERAGAVGAEQVINAPDKPERALRVQPVGKKEAATEAAKIAGQGTEWGDDLSVGLPN
jgi:predicted transcriptional regulator